MQMVRIGLVSHLVRDYNLGCSALAISNIKLMDSVFKEYGVRPHYTIILSKPKEIVDLKEYTSISDYTNNSFDYRVYPRLKTLLKNPFELKHSKAFADLDYIVDLCGGDGYTDNYGFIRLIAESVPVIAARQFHTPIIFGPQTIGPFNTIFGKAVAKHVLGQLKTLYVRDKASFNCVKNLNVKTNVLQVIDVAFALPYSKTQFTDNSFNIGINVSGLLYNGGYNHDNYFNLSFSYKDFIHQLLARLLLDESITVHLISHVIDSQGGEGGVDDDYSVCQALHDQYPCTVLAPRFTSPIEAKNYISGLDLFSGARMHSTIAATSSSVPVIPVAYSRKFNGLFGSLEYPYFIDAKGDISLEDALDLFFRYMNSLDELKTALEKSRQIFTNRLEQYKNSLADIFNLERI